MQIEKLILSQLVGDQEFTRKVLPFLKKEYFETPANQHIFELIDQFVSRYKTLPTYDALYLSAEQLPVTEQIHKDVLAALAMAKETELIGHHQKPWLVDRTEEFCQQRALYIAISESIALIDKGAESAGIIPEKLKQALSVGFHTNIGHDYLEDAASRWDSYHDTTTRLPFDLDILNTITNGGLPPKTLNVVVAGTNVGKSLFLCHVAASALSMGKNVLYITLEMSESEIAKRIDANLLDTAQDDLIKIPRTTYDHAFERLRAKSSMGKLIIKEYPTSGGHVGHFGSLMDELAIKKSFIPDILIVDYINICASLRFKSNQQMNSFLYVKSIAEELRGLAVERNLPCLSATQFNRTGNNNSDPSLNETAESFGLPQTADFMVALVVNEQLDQLGQMQFKQLKNRYADKSKYAKFTVGLNRGKARLTNIAQNGYLTEANPGNTAEPGEADEETMREFEVQPTVPTVLSKRFGKNRFGGTG